MQDIWAVRLDIWVFCGIIMHNFSPYPVGQGGTIPAMIEARLAKSTIGNPAGTGDGKGAAAETPVSPVPCGAGVGPPEKIRRTVTQVERCHVAAWKDPVQP